MAVALNCPVPTDDDHDAWSVMHDSKFAIARERPTLLRRQRLVDAIAGREKGRRAQVTVVSAPVGSGKTTALAATARSLPDGAAAWCTLDAHDNDPVSFGQSVLHSLLSAVSTIEPDRIGAMVRPSCDPLDQAMQLVAESPELLLVLDNVEQLKASSVGATLARLAYHVPSTVSVVLLAHHDPDLPIRLRGSAEVRELRAADLAFTTAEARELFTRNGVEISESDVLTLTQWTNGSAAALHLAAAALRGSEYRERVLATAREGDRAVYDELLATVLAGQRPEIRQFLLQTSIVDVLNAPLAAAICGIASDQAGALISSVASEDVFLEPIPGRTGWFRQQALFADLLRTTLHHESPDVDALYARAAGWFDANQCLEDASRCAVAGHDWDLVAHLVMERWSEKVLNGTCGAIDELPDLPEQVANRSATHRLAAAVLQLEHSRPAAALTLMREIDAEPPSVEPGLELPRALLALQLACVGGTAAGIEAEALTLERWSVREDAPGRVEKVSAAALQGFAEAKLADGDIHAAGQLLQRAVETTTDSDMINASAAASLALVTALTGRVRLAATLNDELHEGWVWPRCASIKATEALTDAICLYHADRLPASQQAIAEAREHVQSNASMQTILNAVRARIATSLADDESAERLLAHAAAGGRPGLLLVLCDALGLWGDLRAGSIRGLRAELSPKSTHPYAIAMSDIERAVRYYSTRDVDDAWRALERALTIATRNGYRRLLVDSGLPVGPLLGGYVVHARPFRTQALQLLERMREADAPDNRSIVETLTERELTVLRYLPTMLSNREIACEMFFSVNTVKTHLKSIYRKLNVARRRDAVDRARALSLI